MAVKIRLKRMGKIRAPYYRVVVMDSRTKRDGRAIEEIGQYHPTEEPSLIDIDSERAQYWLGVGAQPTEQVAALLKVTGDWQKFKGEPGAEGTLRAQEPKPDRRALYEAALAAADREDGGTAPDTRRRSARSERPESAAAGSEAAPRQTPPATEAPAPTPAPDQTAPGQTAPPAASPESAVEEAAPATEGPDAPVGEEATSGATEDTRASQATAQNEA